MLLATALAVALAVMRLSANPVLRVVSLGYTWFFRGTPLLVQIVFWSYLGLLYERISLGVPFTSIHFFSANTNTIVTPFVAGLLALGMNEAAYASEIVRAGLLSVDHGQVEAAHSLGMPPAYTLRRVIVPRAMRVIIPPMGNETISMLKNTALLQLIAVPELYTRASWISAQNLSQVELLIVASATCRAFLWTRKRMNSGSKTAPASPDCPERGCSGSTACTIKPSPGPHRPCEWSAGPRTVSWKPSSRPTPTGGSSASSTTRRS